MAEPLRFCPFCREPFEGLEECPDHGVRLVPWEELLQKDRAKVPGPDEILSPIDLRFGRGVSLVAAALVLVGLALPAAIEGTDIDTATTGFALWQLREDYLMVVPGAAVLSVLVAFRRRTRRKLMAARVATMGAWLVALVAVVVGAIRLQRSVAALPPAGADGTLHPGVGAYLVLAGIACGLVGAWRFGHTSPRPAFRR